MNATDHLTQAKYALLSAERLEHSAAVEDERRLSLLASPLAWRASVLLSKVCRDTARAYRAEYEDAISAATLELVA